MSSLDSEGIWRDFENNLNKKSKPRYFRFNAQFSGSEPAIDDIDKMEKFRQSIHSQPDLSKTIAETVLTLFASSFFFELDTLPSSIFKFYNCSESIRCKNESVAIIPLLRRLHPTKINFMIGQVTLGALSDKNIYKKYYIYRKNVIFHVRHLTEQITVCFKIALNRYLKLGGFSQTIQWFVK
jgi:hypothetical protein